jgi:ABC-type multidrug transport system fused ATPase/permease subunit
MLDQLSNIDINTIIDFISTPSFKTLQMAVVIYVGLLWLSIIIWVTRDAIHRSDSLIFQVLAILLNIIFPILGILLYLIIRPGKTTTEKYYEELEHRLILESIGEKGGEHPHKKTHKKEDKKHKKSK